MVGVGDFASWQASGGTARGKVLRIIKDGVVPGIAVTIRGTPEEPAAQVRIYRPTGKYWQPTDTLVGHKVSTLTKIEPLPPPPSGMAKVAAAATKLLLNMSAWGYDVPILGLAKLEDLEKKDGKVLYQGQWMEVDKPIRSDRKGKKLKVLANKGGYVKLLHFGASGMQDFTQHEDPERKKRFYERFGSTKSANGELALKDKHSPLYWSAKVLW